MSREEAAGMSTEIDTVVSDSDEYLKPIPIATFEGSFVRSFDAKLPALVMNMPEGYPRGMHMNLEVEVRVRNVHYDEDKRGDLIRHHVLVLQEVRLKEAFDPATRVDNVGGNAAGPTSEGDEHDQLASYLAGETSLEQLLELVDIDEATIGRLRVLTDVLSGAEERVLEDAGVGF